MRVDNGQTITIDRCIGIKDRRRNLVYERDYYEYSLDNVTARRVTVMYDHNKCCLCVKTADYLDDWNNVVVVNNSRNPYKPWSDWED